MNRLATEALAITEELGDVIFVGALAAHMHTRERRDSQDIDFVVERPISDDLLLSKGYKKSADGRQPWFSPRGIKIDMYNGGIPGVSYEWAVRNSVTHRIGAAKSLRTLGLESLIISKHRAARDQDIEDLARIAKRWYADIDWNTVQHISNDRFMTQQIRQDMDFLYNS